MSHLSRVIVDISMSAENCQNKAVYILTEQDMPTESQQGTLVFYVNGVKVYIHFRLCIKILISCNHGK